MHTSSLVLLPGSLCDRRVWQHQLRGLSSTSAVSVGDLTRDATIEGMARRVLAAAPSRFALAGLSLGGIVALEVVRQAPERVQRLALLATTARASSAEQRTRWRHIAEMARAGEMHSVVRDIWPTLVHPSRYADAELARTVEDMARAVGPEAYLRQLTALSTRADSQPQLARIACPTLLVAGRADIICPVQLHKEMAAEILDTRLVVVEQCGHLSSLEQPHVITALLSNWLFDRSERGDHSNGA